MELTNMPSMGHARAAAGMVRPLSSASVAPNLTAQHVALQPRISPSAIGCTAN